VGYVTRIGRGALSYVREAREFDRNIKLLLLATALSGLGQGIFGVDFNLYILSMGIQTDTLGRILSAGPFAHAVAAIPLGFLGEMVGYKSLFVAIYLIAGLSQLVQAATPSVGVISAAAFFGGLALAGDFVVRLPFLATYTREAQRTRVFSLSSLLSVISFSAGSLLAGYMPDLLYGLSPHLTTRYRYTLYLAGALILAAVVPALMIAPRPRGKAKKISLHPYLRGIDRFTVQLATVELFVGITMGLIMPFMNIHFTYRLGASREFFGTIAALALLPVAIATAVGPSVAARMGTVRAITVLRFVIPVCTLALALTDHRLLATAAYWGYRALFMTSQSIWFSFAMGTAVPRSKAAAAAWLEITFCLGMGIAAWVTGSLLAVGNYTLPFYLSSAAAVLTGLTTHFFMHSREEQPAKQSA